MKKKSIIPFVIIFLIPLITISQKLTEKKKLDDFEYLYKILDENYPHFGIVDRKKGIKWLEKKSEYIKKIKKTENDKEYYKIIRTVLRDLNSGHTDLMPTLYRDYYFSLYSEMLNKHKRLQPWIDELEKGNNYWSELFNIAPFNQNDQSNQLYDSSLLSFKIIDTNNIAVLTIKSFDHFLINKDTSRIINYINSINNYNNLIIDIQDNEGGDTKYWSEHIVPYFIKDTIFNKTYLARKKGKLVNHFLKNCDFVKENFNKVEQKTNLPKEIIEDHYDIYSSIDTIIPKINIDFSGKIYLLVNRNVYSSAETFAVFCKMTKWATIAGETTGGDGIGTDPVLVCLPNSKLIIRFPGQMGLNPDGSSNEELNTIPDIEIIGRSNTERLIDLVKMINPSLAIENYEILTPNDCPTSAIIYPTNESPDSLNKEILNYVKKVNKSFHNLPDSLIIPDTVAINKKFTNKDIVCYGTYQGNIWLKHKIKDLPIKINTNIIQGKEKHEGGNMILISSWLNPDSKGNFVVVYTAQKPEQIMKINYVYHGSTNYVIANEKYEILEKGNYKYKNENYKIE